MKVTSDLAQINQFLAELHIEEVFNNDLKAYMTLHRFMQGELICSQGDLPQTLFVLVKGKVKVYTTTAEGKTLILSFKKPLELIGDIEYVRGSNYINTVEAVSAVEMIAIDYRWLKKFAKDYAPFLQFLLDIITEKFHIKSNAMSFNLMYPVEVRLASYLLSVSYDETNSLLNDHLNTINLKDAANLIGTSYRHVNRVIQQFCKDDLVERKNGGILIKDRAGLSVLAGNNIYE
ncbi:Crp/Fnr family transcriptional regulator [Gottfriedia acidiceleris]|uniref:Cyclic nucleotide-binding domain-containing protein n=1 Tax=Gottfriedia acidiceleris TaxID=371036 RepID=A0ABY4JLM9_9BACI|nr:cyclic nucleotide-binding domain-containing protein [Gottfriedia acidiceleris]UPM54099.1 cyclic nucleotide-binding domain-containing protein [Gottfriedia acidiceleris]